MTLYYKKKKQIWNLILAIVWIILGILSFEENGGFISRYGYLTIGALYLGVYIFNSVKQFGNLESNRLTKSGLKAKSIHLDQLENVNYFAGDLILADGHHSITINRDHLEPSSFQTIIQHPLIQDKLNIKGDSN